jgi:TolB-like protein/Tfp pilus assembly protein PilF
MTLWFMLTGKLPFDGTRDAIRRKQLSATLPVDQLKGTPRTVVDLMRRMLEADPAKRPQSPAALKEQLNKCTVGIDTAKQKQRRRFAYSALAAVAIVIAALGASYILQRKPFTGAASEIVPEKSIAVLPFENLIDESDSAYIVDGIRAQIAARLAKIANLKVVSGSSAYRYQSTPQNPAQVAAELDVTDILASSVEKQGEKFRIRVRLIDGKNGADLWTQSYERTFPEIIQVERDVARQAANVLGVSLTESEKRAINKTATSNPQAYEAYLKGRYVWLQRNLDSYRQAKEYFEQAIGLDTNYAQAYAGLADAYQFLGAFNLPDRKENYDKAKSAYKRALELDPTLAEAHASAGLIAMNYDWDWPLAEQEFRRALALDPNEAIFYDWYAEYLMAVGRTNESINSIERARELDPFSIIINSDVGKLLFLARHYDQAEAQLKETLRMDPDFSQAHWWLGAVYLMKHRFDQAIAQFKVDEIDGERGLIAYAYGMAGRKTEARQMLEATKNLIAQRGDFDKWSLICAYIGVGENDRAIASLEQDCENHATTAVSLKSNPLFDPLRSEARFVDLLRRVHLTPGGSPVNENVPEKSIAVLPFENLSDEKEHSFFADGVQDDILTKLAKVADLKVISRTSVMQYRGKQDLGQIGQALGVSHVLEGTVRRADGKVHINAQLVDARTNTHVWAEEYDRDLNELFAIEAELAQSIANQLGANVSARETSTMRESPTSDFVAYDLYTRAKNLDLAATFGDKVRGQYLLQSADLLTQAVAHDPSFFEAYCQLARAHNRLYTRYEHTPARLVMAEAAIQAASRLRPDAGETHLARAENRFRGYLDYDNALAELELAHQSLPNDARVFQLAGYILRRQGRWEESTRNWKRAAELNPRDLETLRQIALNYGFLDRYPEEASVLDRALSIDPSHVETKVEQAVMDLSWRADARPLHHVIDEIRAKNPNSVQGIASQWLLCALAERDAASAKAALIAGGETPFADIPTDRQFVEGLIARMTKENGKARAAFTAARIEQENIVQAQPNFGPAWCVLGLIDAALGRKDEALREGRRAVEIVPVKKDSLIGSAMIEYLAMIAAWAGDNDLACEQLAIAVRPPSYIGYGELKLLPYWDPLRGDSRFEKIVASLAPK